MSARGGLVAAAYARGGLVAAAYARRGLVAAAWWRRLNAIDSQYQFSILSYIFKYIVI